MSYRTQIICLVAMTASASAQPTKVESDALFRLGKQLMEQKKFGEACAAFERSHQLDPGLSTLLNHADCREKNGQLATAWRLFLDAEGRMRDKTDAVSRKFRPIAADRARKLAPRLSRLSINVTQDHRLAGLEISRDAAPVDPGEWNSAWPIDGGTYQITARAPGRTDWSTTVDVKSEGDHRVVEVPKLEATVATTRGPARPTEPARPPAIVPTPADAAGPRREVPSLTSRRPQRSLVLPIAMSTGALVLGSAALAFSRWGDRIYDDATREEDDATQDALWRSANKRRYAAIGLAGGAIGCAGVAAYFYLRGRGEPSRSIARRPIRVQPTASASALGLSLRGTW